MYYIHIKQGNPAKIKEIERKLNINLWGNGHNAFFDKIDEAKLFITQAKAITDLVELTISTNPPEKAIF